MPQKSEVRSAVFFCFKLSIPNVSEIIISIVFALLLILYYTTTAFPLPLLFSNVFKEFKDYFLQTNSK